MSQPDSNPEHLLAEHEGLIRAIAQTYAKTGVPLEDLLQEGRIGLWEAAQRFDATREAKFSTYATFWIKKRILEVVQRELANSVNTVELTDTASERLTDKSFVSNHQQPDNRDALRLPATMPIIEQQILRLSYEQQLPIKEIATQLNLSPEKVRQIRQKALRRLKAK